MGNTGLRGVEYHLPVEDTGVGEAQMRCRGTGLNDTDRNV